MTIFNRPNKLLESDAVYTIFKHHLILRLGVRHALGTPDADLRWKRPTPHQVDPSLSPHKIPTVQRLAQGGGPPATRRRLPVSLYLLSAPSFASNFDYHDRQAKP